MAINPNLEPFRDVPLTPAEAAALPPVEIEDPALKRALDLRDKRECLGICQFHGKVEN